jgi:amino acid transporter
MPLLSLALGRRLSSDEQEESKIGVVEGFPALGLDGLSSSAYGPEAALTLLLPLGVYGIHFIIPITAAILFLLGLLYFSYRQTIAAYPVNGGSYTVAKENLGMQAGLLAAAALMIDYVLTVAVGISAGIAALVSAFPHLHKYTLPLCLCTLAAITLLNLRGTADAGRIFSVPTYLFMAAFAVVLGIGLFKTIVHGGHPVAVEIPPPVAGPTEAVGAWILLRTFASGCAAMTGVEAVSNGVSAFRQPTVKNAHRTLTLIIVSLMTLLASIAILATAYHIGAMDQEKHGYRSVLSQLVEAVVGKNWLYYIAIGSVLIVLCLSANTSFVDFPRLSKLIAEDGYLPRSFAMVGGRLVLSIGVLALSVAAGALLVAFKGITDKLIPLYAVGAFVAFTLSQLGMVVRWKREGGKRRALAVNAAGAIGTTIAVVIIFAAKFVEGAWIVVVAVPLLLLGFNSVHRYYGWMREQLAGHEPIQKEDTVEPVVIVPMRDCNRLTDKALKFAMRISDDVVAVHLSNVGGDEAKDEADRMNQEWQKRMTDPAAAHCLNPPRLVIISSPYRLFLDPFLEQLKKFQQDYPGRELAVIVPTIVKTRWWERLLHDGRAARLSRAIVQDGGDNVVVVSVPWHVTGGPPGKL